MLVLSRKANQTLHIGEDIVLTFRRIAGDRVTVGIEAPRDVRIVRGELLDHPQQGMTPSQDGGTDAAGDFEEAKP